MKLWRWTVSDVRVFETGANRDSEDGKLDYEGFLSPLVLKRFAEYMHKNRYMRDGSLRDSDNWQKGIPFDVYMKSLFRHFMDVWSLHRKGGTRAELEEALCGVLFNAMGYLHELEKGKQTPDVVVKFDQKFDQEQLEDIKRRFLAAVKKGRAA